MRLDREGFKQLEHHPLAEHLRRFIQRHGLWALGHFLDDSLRSIWRTRAWSAFTIAIIGLSLATVGAFLIVAENLGGLVRRINSLEVSVYLSDVAEPEELKRARAAIEAMPEVSALRHVSKEEAFELFRQNNPELYRLARDLGENPLPASFEVTLRAEARSPEGIEAFARSVTRLAGVDSVSRDLELAERVLAASRLVKLVAVFLGGVLLLSALFTVSNVVKLTVYARRDEVQILRLVGATSAYVRGLFLTEGVLQGLFGSTLALGLLYLLFRSASSYLVASGLPVLAALTAHFLSGPSVLLLVASGVALGAVGSLVPLRRLA